MLHFIKIRVYRFLGLFHAILVQRTMVLKDGLLQWRLVKKNVSMILLMGYFMNPLEVAEIVLIIIVGQIQTVKGTGVKHVKKENAPEGRPRYARNVSPRAPRPPNRGCT